MSANDSNRWDERYAERSANDMPPPDPLLLQFTPPPTPDARALDVAAGMGQNGLWLAQQGYSVDLMDASRVALNLAYDAALARQLQNVQFYHVDLDTAQLAPDTYDLICVFRFLQRNLIPQLRAALRPGGRIIYQTFNIQQIEVKPDWNPDRLLQMGELAGYFADWRLVHRTERGTISQVVAIKPGVR